MESRVKKVISNVFLIDESQITDDLSPDTLTQWDSIGHLNLITGLEEEFGIIYSEDQIVEMLNLKLVYEVTKEALSYE
jgi:acyl carrier protein